MLLRCEVSEAHTKPVLLVGWCGGERLTDKQSVTAQLSQVRTGGHAYSAARDKVIHDESDKQHWWRLHLISLLCPVASHLVSVSFLPLHRLPSLIFFFHNVKCSPF